MSSRKIAQILVVDDEPELRELLFDALSDDEISVSVAGSGKEAIELARVNKPDLVIADLCLGDCSGLDVIDRVRHDVGDVPAVVITGQGDAASFSEASRHRPLELMTKPLNLDRLRSTISRELHRRADIEQRRSQAEAALHNTCTDLTGAYRALSEQVLGHRTVIQYQGELIVGRSDDDVFRAFFRMFVQQSGSVFGIALVCDSNAELRITGRFGVPKPDGLEFCRMLSDPLTDILLTDPFVQLVEAGDEPEAYDESIRRYLPGLSVLAIPLIPAPGEMIGMVLLYRKGEQPFTDEDIELANMISYPTAIAVRRND